MKALHFFRAVVCLMSLFWADAAAAQMRDMENATPRVPVSPVERVEVGADVAHSLVECAALLHELTTTLQLAPNQVLALRSTLAAHLRPTGPAGAEAAAGPALRTLLTAARLRTWEAAQPASRRGKLVASLQ